MAGEFGGRWTSGKHVNCYCYAVHHKPHEGGTQLEPGALSGDQWQDPRDPRHFWALVMRDGATPFPPSYTAAPPAMPAPGTNPGHYLIAMKLNSDGFENYHAMRRDEETGAWWQTTLGLSKFTNETIIFTDDRINAGNPPHLALWVDPRAVALQPMDLWIGYFWVPVRGLQGPPARCRDGCCYITTATCLAQGLGDDCDELATLRWFRDRVLLLTVQGQSEVAEYYRHAPALVALINQRTDAAQLYAAMYREGILPAVAAVKRGDFSTAHAIFRHQVERLRNHVAPPPPGRRGILPCKDT